jgi:hypothetical protein
MCDADLTCLCPKAEIAVAGRIYAAIWPVSGQNENKRRCDNEEVPRTIGWSRRGE